MPKISELTYSVMDVSDILTLANSVAPNRVTTTSNGWLIVDDDKSTTINQTGKLANIISANYELAAILNIINDVSVSSYELLTYIWNDIHHEQYLDKPWCKVFRQWVLERNTADTTLIGGISIYNTINEQRLTVAAGTEETEYASDVIQLASTYFYSKMQWANNLGLDTYMLPLPKYTKSTHLNVVKHISNNEYTTVRSVSYNDVIDIRGVTFNIRDDITETMSNIIFINLNVGLVTPTTPQDLWHTFMSRIKPSVEIYKHLSIKANKE